MNVNRLSRYRRDPHSGAQRQLSPAGRTFVRSEMGYQKELRNTVLGSLRSSPLSSRNQYANLTATRRANKQQLRMNMIRNNIPSYRPTTTSGLLNNFKKLIPTSAGSSRVGNFLGKSLLGAGAIAGVGLGIASGISSYAQSLRRPPVVHTSRLRNTGQTNQYYNMGADPFAGVRFAGRKKNFM